MNLEPMKFGLEGVELTPLLLRTRIEELEALMFKSPERIEIPVVNHFARGLYAREVTLPTGTVASGKIHKFEHLVFITKGDISVLTEHGVKRFKAPVTFKSLPGTKRVVYCHEETTFTTVHATDVQSEAEADKKLVVESYQEFFAFIDEEKKLCLT